MRLDLRVCQGDLLIASHRVVSSRCAELLAEYLLLAMAVLNVSTASILVRLSGVHGFVAATWRLIFSSLLTLAFVATSRELRDELAKISRRDVALMVLSGLMLALHFDLWMTSLQHLSVAASVTIVDSYPAVLALVGYTLFKERYSAMQLAGAGVAIAGITLLSLHSSGGGITPPGGNPVLGVAASFSGMLAVATYFSIGKDVRARLSTATYTGVVYASGALFSMAATFLLRKPLTGFQAETWMYLALLALLPMLGGHTVINYLLSRLSLLASTAPILGEPVGASILAMIVLDEPLEGATAAYMAITLSGIGMVVLGEKRRLAQ